MLSQIVLNKLFRIEIKLFNFTPDNRLYGSFSQTNGQINKNVKIRIRINERVSNNEYLVKKIVQTDHSYGENTFASKKHVCCLLAIKIME